MQFFMFQALAALVFIACCIQAKASEVTVLDPYASIKRGIHRVKFQPLYGEPVFNESFHITSVGLGAQLGDNMLFEVWHGIGRESTKLKAIEAGRSLPGCPICMAGDEMCVVRTRVQHVSTDVHLIYFTDKKFNARFLFGGGLSNIKFKGSHELYADNFAGMPDSNIINLSRRTYSLKSFVPRGTIGVEYFIGDSGSFRLEYDWKRTQGKSAKSAERPNGLARISMRSTNVISFGFSYRF